MGLTGLLAFPAAFYWSLVSMSTGETNSDDVYRYTTHEANDL